MKKYISVLLAVLIFLCFAGCDTQKSTAFAETDAASAKYDKIAASAEKLVKEYWKQLYDTEAAANSDGYFEINNTRIIVIKENDTDLFADVSCIVEFELFTDYYGSAPYYDNASVYDTVVVYKDGTMEVTDNLMRIHRRHTYQNDFSGFIEAVLDYEDRYNCIENLK